MDGVHGHDLGRHGHGPRLAVEYLVGNEAESQSALASQANGDTITLSNDITLTVGGGGNLPEMNSTVTISGGGHTLSGGGVYRGLFVPSDTVRVENLTISDALAPGRQQRRWRGRRGAWRSAVRQ